MNVREMYNYGYKWTGMIPLTAEEARNLFLNDKYPYGKPQTDEVARGSGNREYGCRRLREKLPNVQESLFLEPGIPIV